MIPAPKKYFHCLVCDALCEMEISDDSMARIICFSICPDCKKAILYARELMNEDKKETCFDGVLKD